MNEAVASPDTTQVDSCGGIVEDRFRPPGVGMGACEKKVDDVVAKDGQAADHCPDEQATTKEHTTAALFNLIHRVGFLPANRVTLY